MTTLPAHKKQILEKLDGMKRKPIKLLGNVGIWKDTDAEKEAHYHDEGYNQALTDLQPVLASALDSQLSLIRQEVEKYFGHILNDGTGKSMHLEADEIAKDLQAILAPEKGEIKTVDCGDTHDCEEAH